MAETEGFILHFLCASKDYLYIVISCAMYKTLEEWVKTFGLSYLIFGLIAIGTMFLSDIQTIHGFRLQILYFIILCFANTLLLHGLKMRKIHCGILWLVIGFMEIVMILIYSISHIYICVVNQDTNNLVIFIIFLFAAVFNIFCWFVVYRFVTKLASETISIQNQRENETNDGQMKIRYNANGQIDILQDPRGLTPGIYAIAPVHHGAWSLSTTANQCASESGSYMKSKACRMN